MVYVSVFFYSEFFYSVFEVFFSYSQIIDMKVFDEYINSIVYLIVLMFGGFFFRVNFIINQWEDQF